MLGQIRVMFAMSRDGLLPTGLARTNQRGTPGLIDREVVSIFEKWGFTWGGTWHYTDPMHFQLDRVVGGRAQSDP